MRVTRWAAAVVAVALCTGPAMPAYATFTAGGTVLTPLRTYCSKVSSQVYDWWGMTEDSSVWSPRYIPFGVMQFCMEKYRIEDDDPNFDYYAITIKSTWTRTSTLDNYDGGYPAVMNQSVYSNWAARDGVYDATPTYTSTSSCGTEVDLSIALGPFGIGTALQACGGETIYQISDTDRGAAWGTHHVGRVSTVETTYGQKIPQGGSIPLYDIQFRVPQYTSSNDGTFWYYTPAWNNITYPRW